MSKKVQNYLNIHRVGIMCADVETREISHSDMFLPKIDTAKEVGSLSRAYGFRYSKKEYIEEDGEKVFGKDGAMQPFNFIDPVRISECSINEGIYKIDVKNDWAQYYCNEGDNIIFTSVEAEKAFNHYCPLRIIGYKEG